VTSYDYALDLYLAFHLWATPKNMLHIPPVFSGGNSRLPHSIPHTIEGANEGVFATSEWLGYNRGIVVASKPVVLMCVPTKAAQGIIYSDPAD